MADLTSLDLWIAFLAMNSIRAFDGFKEIVACEAFTAETWIFRVGLAHQDIPGKPSRHCDMPASPSFRQCRVLGNEGKAA